MIAGQSTGTQDSISLITQPGRLAGRKKLPACCRAATGAIHYYARSPAGSWVSSVTGVAYRHVHTPRFLPGCIRAITFHCSVSRVLKLQGLGVVKIGSIEFDIELLISLFEAGLVLWYKTDDSYKERNETKKGLEKCLYLTSRRI
jgi:hypothetical protein